MYIQDSYLTGAAHDHSFSPSRSYRDVSYSCGSCGYALNLSSSNRNTSSISSKYGKSMKRGIISFVSIDESRFTLVDEVHCFPFFLPKGPWGLFRRRTKLLCRKCGNRVGTAYKESTSSDSIGPDVSHSSLSKENSVCKKYDIKIRSLQPSSEESGAPLFM